MATIKIARLPREICEQLNRRLVAGELDWQETGAPEIGELAELVLGTPKSGGIPMQTPGNQCPSGFVRLC